MRRKMHNPRVKTARTLRRRSTEAEKLLWGQLRNRRLENFKFRRQHPIGPYIVDFYCEKVGIVVELDGSQHAWNRALDIKRDNRLRSRKIRVLRFWNSEVFENLEGVLFLSVKSV